MNLTLFDLDGTLIAQDSDHAFGEFLIQLGWADPVAHRAANDTFYAAYLAGALDMPAYIDFATAPWRARDPAQVDAVRERFVAEVIDPMLTPQARALVDRHREAGDLLAVVTATNAYVTRPIANRLGIDALIATDLARDASGRPTGAIEGTPAFREGKVARVEAWLADRGQGQGRGSFDRVTFYSDSINDLPLLEWASHPVATNPGPALERIARERGWPVLQLFSP